MYKKTITFKDLEGNNISRDFYFNLSKPELIKLDASVPGGMQNYIKKTQEEKNIGGLLNFIESFITMAYGEKGDDGISFIKVRNGEKLGENFKQTNAYEVLFTELVNGTDNGAAFTEFLNGVIPSDLMSQAKIEQQKFLENRNK
jgi:hypothetical protein